MDAGWLPLVFLVVMGLAMLAYVVLDGYDLGVGILLRRADDAQKDTHDRLDRAVLGRQRNLAGAGRRHPADRPSRGRTA